MQLSLGNRLFFFVGKILFWLFPGFVKSILNRKYFSKIQIKVDDLSIHGPVYVKEPKRLFLNNNIVLKGNNVIDCDGGIILGSNVEMESNVDLFTKTSDSFGPIIIAPNNKIDKNTSIEPNSFIGQDFNKSNLYTQKASMVFILGTGRSGTNAVSSVLNAQSDVMCLHDPFPHVSFWTSDFLYGEYGEEELINKLRFLYQSIDSQPYRLIGQSDQKFGAIIPQLHTLFPNAKFLWVLRDGRDFVNSAYPRGWFRNSEYGYKPNRNEFIDSKAVPSQMHAFNRLNGFKLGLFTEDKWKNMSAFERCCWYWNYWNIKIENDLKNVPDNQKLTMKLEDISSQKSKLSEFLEIESDFNFEVTNKASYTRLETSDWTSEMQGLFRAHCNESMNKWYPSR